MRIVHTYINNMGIELSNPNKVTFAHRWGLVAQADLGHEIMLVCGGKNGRKEYDFLGIKVIELPILFQVTTSSRVVRGLWRELFKIDADIFHSHHYCSFVPEISLVVGKLRRIPTFVTMHNTFVEGGTIAKSFGVVYLIFLQLFLNLYSKVFFISNYVQNKIQFSLLFGHKKQVLYNYVVRPPALKVKRIENSILFIGRVMHQKGLDVLLRVIVLVKEKIPEVRLNVVGKGTKCYENKVKRMVKELKMDENVVLHGPLYSKDKWKQFYSNSLLVVPSRDEGFGNVVIEGMICEIPVIVSNKGALVEASGGNAIIVDLNNINDFADKIIKVLNGGKDVKSMVAKGVAYSKMFTENRIGNETTTIYKDFLR